MNHLRFLRYVDEIARCGSVTKAAERLHVAPSAVNRRLQDIEEELDTQLFERLPRGMRLTTAGELFIAYVRSRQTELERVRSQIEELKGLRRGVLRLVVSQAVAASLVPRAIAAFRKTHPHVAFEVHVGDHTHALATLRAYESDLAVVLNLAPEADVQRIAVAEQRVVAVVHKTHPLAASKEGVHLRELIEYPLALPNQNSAARQLLDKFLVKSSLKVQPVIESNSFEFLRYCLYDGRTVSLQLTVGANIQSNEFVSRVIEERGFPKGQLVLATLAGRHLPVVASAFAAHLEKEFAKGGATTDDFV
jgi:DNA-binding transcriptional LysR family regulator